MERISRQYGLYLLMMAAVLAIQMVFSYGGMDDLGEFKPDKAASSLEAKRFEEVVAPLREGRIPLALFAAGFALALILGSGLAADAVIFMKWLLAKSAGKPFLNIRSQGPGPWELEDLFKIFVIFFFAISCLRAVIVIALVQQWMAWSILERISLFLNSIGLYAIVLGTLAYWSRRKGISIVQSLGFSSPGIWGRIGLGAGTYLAFVPALVVLLFASLLLCKVFGIEPQSHELVDILTRERSPLRLVFLGALTMLLGPLVEEVVFRGVVYSAMRKRMGVYGAAAASSLIFAIAHANAAQTLPIFGMGMVLAVLYEHTGSLVASITFHVMNNALAFALTVLVLSLMR